MFFPAAVMIFEIKLVAHNVRNAGNTCRMAHNWVQDVILKLLPRVKLEED